MAISVEKKGAENNDNALNKKEAALIKNRKALIYGVLAIIIIIAGYLAYKTYYAEPFCLDPGANEIDIYFSSWITKAPDIEVTWYERSV